jgi:hypothetical protein
MSSGSGNDKGIDGHLFRLIATFEAAAMQQLGKIANPITGDVEVSLEGAADAIEMLDMVRRKTEGNLNEDERRFLDHALYQLRMNYVDVANAGDQGAPGEEADDGGDGAAAGGMAGGASEDDSSTEDAAESDSKADEAPEDETT